jgi:hypothetical protein
MSRLRKRFSRRAKRLQAGTMYASSCWSGEGKGFMAGGDVWPDGAGDAARGLK